MTLRSVAREIELVSLVQILADAHLVYLLLMSMRKAKCYVFYLQLRVKQ